MRGAHYMPRYSIVLFDADETLLDFKRSEAEAVCDVLDFFEIPPSEEHIKKYSEINEMHWKMLERGEIKKKDLYTSRWKMFCEFFGVDLDPEDISEKYIECLSQKSYMLDGALELCGKLSGKCRMYLITNGTKRVQEGRLALCPLYPLFDGCFISEDIGFDKPRLEYFSEVEKRIPNFEKSKAIVIGDSLTSDIAGGIAAGIDTCWYDPKGKIAPEGMNITYIRHNLAEIEDVVLWGK